MTKNGGLANLSPVLNAKKMQLLSIFLALQRMSLVSELRWTLPSACHVTLYGGTLQKHDGEGNV